MQVHAVKRSTPEDFRSTQRMSKSPIIIKQAKSRFRQVLAMPSILANISISIKVTQDTFSHSRSHIQMYIHSHIYKHTHYIQVT